MRDAFERQADALQQELQTRCGESAGRRCAMWQLEQAVCLGGVRLGGKAVSSCPAILLPLVCRLQGWGEELAALVLQQGLSPRLQVGGGGMLG